MASSLHRGGVVMLSQITHSELSNVHPLVHLLGTCAVISVVVPFLQFIPTASCDVIPPLSR